MAEILYKAIIKFRRATSAEWTTINPTLREGEPGFEMDTGKLKVGNGTTAWKDLPYIGGDSINVDTDDVSIIIDGLGKLSLKGFAEAQAGQILRKGTSGDLEWYTPTPSEGGGLNGITIGGVDAPIEDNKANIPIGTNDALGVIKGSDEDNKIKILADGTAEVNSLEVDRLKNKDGFYLILDGGTATL